MVGAVRYVHTPRPEHAADPETAVHAASDVLASLFREHRIETVQAASNSRNGLPALLAARKVGAPFVYEVRGLWELTAAARFAGWEETERYRFDRQLEVLVARHADHVLAITRGVADELVAGGVPVERISILPNAVDPDLFVPIPRSEILAERFRISADDFVVVYAGSLSSYEGLDDLIAALALVQEAGVAVRLVLAGEGEYRPALEALAARTGITDRVIFAGKVNPDEVRAFLSLADAVALPRKPLRVCEVVSPLKPFEAMSMAKPVVLSNLAALREIVVDGQTGLLCRPGDPAHLAEILLQLVRDPSQRWRLGQEAREWIVKERSWARNADALRMLYAHLNAVPHFENA
jgi:glycosyltransferase involved in cell wall biosynthesis